MIWRRLFPVLLLALPAACVAAENKQTPAANVLAVISSYIEQAGGKLVYAKFPFKFNRITAMDVQRLCPARMPGKESMFAVWERSERVVWPVVQGVVFFDFDLVFHSGPRSKKSWKMFENFYPHKRGYCLVSPIFYSDSNRNALVYTEARFKYSCSIARVFLLRKSHRGSGYRIVDSEILFTALPSRLE